MALPESEFGGPVLSLQLVPQLGQQKTQSITPQRKRADQVLLCCLRKFLSPRRPGWGLGCQLTRTWALLRLMSSLIRWDARMASWAAAMLAWLKRTHSSGVEELQQEHSCGEALSGPQCPRTGLSPGYPAGIRVGFVFRDICADSLVSDRQDRSISRASILSWMSAASRCRASCRSLGATTGGCRRDRQEEGKVQGVFFPSPRLLEAAVDVLLQDAPSSFSQLHLLPQLLIHRVRHQLFVAPPVPQRQALSAHLQGSGGGGQGLLRLLLSLSRNVVAPAFSSASSSLHDCLKLVLSLNDLFNRRKMTHSGQEPSSCTHTGLALGTFFWCALTRVRASISLSTSCVQVSKASFHRATSQALSLNRWEVSLSSQAVCRGEREERERTQMVHTNRRRRTHPAVGLVAERPSLLTDGGGGQSLVLGGGGQLLVVSEPVQHAVVLAGFGGHSRHPAGEAQPGTIALNIPTAAHQHGKVHHRSDDTNIPAPQNHEQFPTIQVTTTKTSGDNFVRTENTCTEKEQQPGGKVPFDLVQAVFGCS